MTSLLIGSVGIVEPLSLTPQQLPTIPVEPPDPSAEIYGRMSWDLPSAISYVAYREVTAIVEIWNPTSTDGIYAVAYYFIDPQGSIVAQDYLYFTTDGVTFPAFILHAYAPEHMITVTTFKAPSAGYKFGLRLLELEMVDSVAAVKHETSRLEVLLGVAQDGGIQITDLLGALIVIVPMAMITKKILPKGG